MLCEGESVDSPSFYLYNQFMRINVELNNLTKSSIKKDLLATVVKKTLEEAGFDFLKKKTVSVSVAIISKKEIKRLNKVYRKKDAVTDVLSFAEYKNIAKIKAAVDKVIFLGELILCYDDIKEYAKKRGLARKKELAKVISHGVLHLLGFRHGPKMFKIQDNILWNK